MLQSAPSIQVHRGEALGARQRVLRILGATGPAGLWLFIFFLVPLLLIVGVSFLSRGENGTVETPWTFEAYRRLAGLGLLGFDPLYPIILARSLALGAGTALLCVLCAMPLGLFIAGLRAKWKTAALTLGIIPLWTKL